MTIIEPSQSFPPTFTPSLTTCVFCHGFSLSLFSQGGYDPASHPSPCDTRSASADVSAPIERSRVFKWVSFAANSFVNSLHPVKEVRGQRWGAWPRLVPLDHCLLSAERTTARSSGVAGTR